MWCAESFSSSSECLASPPYFGNVITLIWAWMKSFLRWLTCHWDRGLSSDRRALGLSSPLAHMPFLPEHTTYCWSNYYIRYQHHLFPILLVLCISSSCFSLYKIRKSWNHIIAIHKTSNQHQQFLPRRQSLREPEEHWGLHQHTCLHPPAPSQRRAEVAPQLNQFSF